MRVALIIAMAVLLLQCSNSSESENKTTMQNTPTEADDAPSPSGYLDLVLEVTEEGEVFVISGGEFDGRPIVNDQPIGDCVVEVTHDDKTLYLEAIVDPFAGHSFGGPQDEQQGHHLIELTSGTIKAKVPGASLEYIPEDIEVRLLKIIDAGSVMLVNVETLRDLRKQNRIKTIAVIDGKSLATALREK